MIHRVRRVRRPVALHTSSTLPLPPSRAVLVWVSRVVRVVTLGGGRGGEESVRGLGRAGAGAAAAGRTAVGRGPSLQYCCRLAIGAPHAPNGP